MGNLSSKIAKSLPSQSRSSAVNGRLGSDVPPHPVSRPTPVAKETKDHDIEMDGKDPHLLANLGRLGQVNVPTSTSGSTSAKIGQVSQIYRTRGLAEQQATSTTPVRNKLVAGSLSNLLDDRKSASSRRELEQLAARYTVDATVLDSLAKFVNTPSIGEGTLLRTIGDDGQEKVTMEAVWTHPIMKGT